MRQTKGINLVIVLALSPSPKGKGEWYALLLWCKCSFRIPCLQPDGYPNHHFRKVGFGFMGLYVHANRKPIEPRQGVMQANAFVIWRFVYLSIGSHSAIKVNAERHSQR